jgi:hypothetical protein
MLPIRLDDDGLRFGRHLVVSFHRTVRVPETDSDFPLPPTFGRFPLARTQSGAEQFELAIPIRKREALWIAFEGPDWRPNAVKVGVGDVNAVDGRPWEPGLRSDPQNYIVTGTQFWLDGVNAGDGFVRQFVATPFGEGLTIEEQVGAARQGGIRLDVFDPKPGLFPEEPPPQEAVEPGLLAEPPLGLGAGGRIRQKIHADPHGLDVWDAASAASVFVRLLDPAAFTALTGREAPPTPIDAATYTRLGLPWFDYYEDQATDIPAAEIFGNLKTVSSPEKTNETDLDALRIRRIGSDGG